MDGHAITQPSRFLQRMVLFLIVAGATIGLLFTALREAFMANAVLNGVIIGVLLIGIVHAFRTVTMLRREVAWTESFRRDSLTVSSASAPRLLAPMATMLGEKTGRISLSTLAMRTLLDGIAARLDESREISRYMIGLLVFLGLLGTFWGLLETVQAVGNVVGGLQIGGNGKQSVPAYIQALLEQTADGLEGLQRALVRSEENRTDYSRYVHDLTDKISALTNQMSTEQSLMLKLAESQQALQPILAKLAEKGGDSSEDASRGHLRNIETYLARIREEMGSGRNEAVQEIRSEIRLLARTIAALAEDTER